MSNGLTWNEFQPLALRTESIVENGNIDMEGLKALLRLYITIGKFLDFTKKGIFYNNYTKYDTNHFALIDELNENTFNFLATEGPENRKVVTDLNFRVLHGLLGPLTESSELAEHLLNYLENNELDPVGIAEEFADSDWYKAIIFDDLGISNDIALRNVIEKLKIRFPGKYSDAFAEFRQLDAERKELEKSIGDSNA